MLTASAEGKIAVRRAVAPRIEWLGQMAASIFWIASVFTYGLTAPGDWLQLFAASAWLVANLASLARRDPS